MPRDGTGRTVPRAGVETRRTGHADLVDHLARFAGELRRRGVPVGLRDEIDAAAALPFIDMSDPDEVRISLRTTLKVPRRWWTAFDAAFDAMWRSAARPGPVGSGRRDGRSLPRRWRGDKPGVPPLLRIRRQMDPAAGAAGAEEEEAEGGRPGYSPRALLRRKAFDECTEEDLLEMERLLARLARRIAVRRSRRLVPSGKGPLIDLRRSFRRSLAHGGEWIDLARRERAVELPRLVVLCDTSGSMDAYSRFLLTFVLSLRAVTGRVETFAFNTSLTRLTPWITSGNATATLERLARNVEDWSGGTRIGECLLAFAADHLHTTVRSDTTVLVLSDGLDRGDTESLETALLAIRRRARQVVWLNPLMGDPRYRPEARGMRAALPHVDRLVPAHDLESLEALLPLLTG